MHNRLKLLSLFIFFTPVCALHGQAVQDYLQQFIEIITENAGGEEEFDYTELGEQITIWQKVPVDINSSEAEEFVQWKIISDYAYRQLQDHIERNGPLLDLLELQSVPGFTPENIRAV